MDAFQSPLAGTCSNQGADAQWNQETGGRGREAPSRDSASMEDAVLVSKSDFEDEDIADVISVDSDDNFDTDSETESEEEESEDEWDSDEDDEEEDDEDLEERLQALADARALKNLAVHFLHPELPVTTDIAAFGRNYYTRPSVVEQEEDNEEERTAILADAAALKKLAVDYAHPEEGVSTSDPTSFGRNYFNRPSALEQEDEETADEVEDIMDDVAMLKRAAYDYLHPEAPVKVDSTAFGRNYFNRASAPEQEDEDSEEREAILAEAKALKKLAIDFAHPERSVEVEPTSFARNYFGRPSASAQEDEEDAEEREAILAEAKALKKLAVDFAHPEKPVEVDATAFGRNYFSRPSAEQEDEDSEEMEAILAEAKALKKLAVDFAHPEQSVEVDPSAFARNYFGRPSAPAQEDEEDAEEREAILAEAKALKKLAVDFAHPEKSVGVDATAFGRNYFSRPSAPAQEDEEDAEEMETLLAEAKALKKLAVDFAHPEKSVEVDATAFGRNYFSRPSAEQEDEDSEEMEAILAEAKALKKLAVDFSHPERSVEVEPTSFARSYFSRPSASAQEDEEDAEEREAILAEAKALKKLAIDFAHPEKSVGVDATAFGRNYFSRPSAPAQEDEEDAEEREAILAEAKALKKLAVDFAHPEQSVEVDPSAFARSYFSRPSAEQEDEEDAEEREAILAEAKALKKLAVDFAHPEKSVEVDATAFGRNYFSRPSAEQEDEDSEEREAILAEAKALKKLAVDFAHPEKSVEVDPASFARNYFGRPSAPAQEDEEDAEEREAILAEAKALKKLAVDFAHPEKSVEVDATAFGRNYFSRPSAPAQEDEEDAEEMETLLAEAKALKKLAVDFAHPEKSVEVDPTSFARNYFTLPSSSGSSEAISSTGASERKPSAKAADRNARNDHFDFDHLHEDLHAM